MKEREREPSSDLPAAAVSHAREDTHRFILREGLWDLQKTHVSDSRGAGGRFHIYKTYRGLVSSLCPPKYVPILTPDTWERGLDWTQGLCSCDQAMMTSCRMKVGPRPVTGGTEEGPDTPREGHGMTETGHQGSPATTRKEHGEHSPSEPREGASPPDTCGLQFWPQELRESIPAPLSHPVCDQLL